VAIEVDSVSPNPLPTRLDGKFSAIRSTSAGAIGAPP
jgi:hypothetical protein